MREKHNVHGSAAVCAAKTVESPMKNIVFINRVIKQLEEKS